MSNRIKAAQQPPGILSALSLSDWCGSLTIFLYWWQTTPVGQLKNAEWSAIVSLLRPEKPAIVADKAFSQSFLPCLLKEAPLVGRTREAAQKTGQLTVGRMRSRAHVTEARMLVMDIDGLAEADFMAGLAKLANDGITYLAYTTYSFGCADKAGIRARLIVPLDGGLDTEGYRLTWCGFDRRYWNGQVGKADPSAARLCQQQGMWCCHPGRLGQARSWTHSGGVASAVALREIGALSSEAPRVKLNGTAASPAWAKDLSRPASLADEEATLAQLEGLISGIHPDCHYDDWLRVLAVIFNETGGSEEGFALANRWSSAGEKYKGERELGAKWGSFRLDHPNPARLGSLIHMIRNADRAVA